MPKSVDILLAFLGMYEIGSKDRSQAMACSVIQQHHDLWLYAAVGWQSIQKSAHRTYCEPELSCSGRKNILFSLTLLCHKGFQHGMRVFCVFRAYTFSVSSDIWSRLPRPADTVALCTRAERHMSDVQRMSNISIPISGAQA